MDENKRMVPQRGDSFDIQPFQSANVIDQQEQDQLAKLLQNPSELAESLGLNESQMRNVKSIAVGAGASLVHKWLVPHIGDELASGASGFLATSVARKILGGPK